MQALNPKALCKVSKTCTLATNYNFSYNYTVISYNMHRNYTQLHTYVIYQCIIIAVQHNTKCYFDALCQLLGAMYASRPLDLKRLFLLILPQ